jgi:hypothetical protein
MTENQPSQGTASGGSREILIAMGLKPADL